MGHLGLFDQRDCGRERFDRTRVFAGRGIRDGSCNSGTADGSVPRHNLLELGLTQLGCYAVLGERTTWRFSSRPRPRSARGRSALGVKMRRWTLSRRGTMWRGSAVGMTAGVTALVEEGRIHMRSRTLPGATHRWAPTGAALHVAGWSLPRSWRSRWKATWSPVYRRSIPVRSWSSGRRIIHEPVT